MKTLVKTLMLLSWVMLPLMMACTSEVESPGGVTEQPENPQANDPNRRSVVIALQNKLILINGTPESRALTRDGIAEEDENRIETFDIYAFGSDKEEGPYTFQERFAYRPDVASMPADASKLELKADEATGKVNVVFYPRKGLYTKFYCVANQAQLYDVAGHAYTNYTPLQQAKQPQAGLPGDAVTAPGTPTENDFIKLNSPLLNPAGLNADILLAPLPMSGSNAQPTDLRQYNMGTYVRLNISLTRAVARFDVVNNAAKSHFTITDIALGNGRQGVTLFPIRPLGDIPAATGQLIMYPYRPFDGLNANAGPTTKAFYCYPSHIMDEGFLILKGLYAVNLTDEKKEVTYRIPFERVTDGNGSRIEISHNHRYTVQITEADPFELQANIRLVDWETGGDVDDYEPDNGVEGITVTELLPANETTYDVGTASVTLPVKAGSSFVATASSNGGIEAKLGYQGSTQSVDGWLKLEEIIEPASRVEGTKQAKFKVSINENYTGADYPRGVLRLIDKAGGGEEVVLVNIDNTPLVKPIAVTMSPEGVNNWDTTEKTLYLVQTTAGNESTATITVVSKDGSKIELPDNSGITVSPTSSTSTTQKYTFSWAGTDATDLLAKEITVTLKNGPDETKTENIKVKLLPNKIENLTLASAESGIALSEVTATTAKLTMPIIKDKQFTITMDNYSRPTVSKCPAWLENITPVSTRSTPESKTASFTFKLIENAANFDDTQLVFANAAGGTGMTVAIAREFQAPTIKSSGAMTPNLNSLNGNTLRMYRVKSGQESKAQITVYSLGGSTLTLPGGWCSQRLITTSNNYEKTYEIYWAGDTNQLGSSNTGTCYLKNASDTSKQITTTLIQEKAIPTVSSDYDCVVLVLQNATLYNFDVGRNNGESLNFKYYFDFKIYSPAGVKINGPYIFGDISITQKSTWSTNARYDTFQFYISGQKQFPGGGTPIGTITFRSNNSDFFPDFQFKMYNYAPIVNGNFYQ